MELHPNRYQEFIIKRRHDIPTGLFYILTSHSHKSTSVNNIIKGACISFSSLRVLQCWSTVRLLVCLSATAG